MTFRLSAYYFFYFAFVGVFSPYFGIYLQSRAFSAFDISLLMSQMQLMRLAGPFIWGALADKKLNHRAIIQASALLSLLGFSVFFWAEKLETLMIAMAILAFFWSAALPIVETLTFEHLRDRTADYGKIRMWGSIGFILAVMALGWLLDRLPVDSVLWSSWLVLLGILAIALSFPERPAPVQASDANASPALPFKALLKSKKVQGLLLSCMAMSAAHGALYIFYSIHLAEHGYSKTATGVLWSLGVIAEILLFMLMPNALKRWPLKQILLACYLVAILRFLVIGWWIDSLVLAVIAQVFHGLTFGAHHVASISAINAWFPGKNQSRGQALYSSLSFGAGGLLGGLLSGFLWEHYGGNWTYTLSAVLALVGALMVQQWLPRHPHP